MNRKIWFYGTTLMALLMVIATYLAIGADSSSWEDITGRQTLCNWVSVAPRDAPEPANCAILLNCTNPTSTGRDGFCTTVRGVYTGSRFLRNQQTAPNRIIKKERNCTFNWGFCDDEGVTNTYGSLNECLITSC